MGKSCLVVLKWPRWVRFKPTMPEKSGLWRLLHTSRKSKLTFTTFLSHKSRAASPLQRGDLLVGDPEQWLNYRPVAAETNRGKVVVVSAVLHPHTVRKMHRWDQCGKRLFEVFITVHKQRDQNSEKGRKQEIHMTSPSFIWLILKAAKQHEHQCYFVWKEAFYKCLCYH